MIWIHMHCTRFMEQLHMQISPGTLISPLWARDSIPWRNLRELESLCQRYASPLVRRPTKKQPEEGEDL